VGKRVFVEIFLGVCSWLWKKLKKSQNNWYSIAGSDW
jgi:hypothetical protein